MAKSIGKVFEEEIKASFPKNFFVERYKDDTAGFKGVSNPADYRLYRYPYTILLELKTHKGKSLPLSKIRLEQIKRMYGASQNRGVIAGFIINYRDFEETYFVPVGVIVASYYIVENGAVKEVNPTGRKSIPVEWCRAWGVKIPQQKKRVRYTYDLQSWLGGYYGGAV